MNLIRLLTRFANRFYKGFAHIFYKGIVQMDVDIWMKLNRKVFFEFEIILYGNTGVPSGYFGPPKFRT